MIKIFQEKYYKIEVDEHLTESIKNCILKIYNNPKLAERMSMAALEHSKLFTKKEYYIEFVKLMNVYINKGMNNNVN